MDESQRNKAVVEKFFSMLGTADVEGLKSFMADDLQWIVPQSPEFSPWAGVRTKSEWETLYRSFLKSMPNGATYQIVGMTAEGARVAVEAESHADTPVGPFGNRYHFLFELRGERIVVVKEYADSLYMYMFARKAAGG